ASSAQNIAGLGLGLAIAKHLVEAHGGTIRCSSKGKGHGSEFLVTLPTRSNVKSTPKVDLKVESRKDDILFMERTTREETLHNMHILLVEDAEDSNNLFKIILEREGAIVDSYLNAPDALAAFS